MATLTASATLDMSAGLNIGHWGGATEVIATPTYIRGTSADFMHRGFYLGSFVVNASAQAQSGTVSGYEGFYKSIGYVSQFKLTGLNYSLDGFFSARSANTRAEFTKALLQSADTITGSSGGDKLYGWNGNDTINSGSGSDYLYGGNGNDKLNSGAGNDRLYGGLGKDTLTGSSGADIFDFNSGAEAGTTSANRDIIIDFQRGSDKIDLSGIDASSKLSGNNSFKKLIASGPFTAPGQLKFAGGILFGNIDSDSSSEFSITLTGISKLSLSDIIL